MNALNSRHIPCPLSPGYYLIVFNADKGVQLVQRCTAVLFRLDLWLPQQYLKKKKGFHPGQDNTDFP